MNPNTHTLYKYRPLYATGADGQKKPHPFTEAIFLESKIYYAAPSSFNDPFDCNLRLETHGNTPREWKQYFEYLIKKAPLSERPGFSKKIKYVLAKKKHREFLEEALAKTYDEHYKKSSVLCLSTKPNSIPMFSYYADSHKGVAIEFQFSNSEVPCGIEFKGGSNPVAWYGNKVMFGTINYADKFPDLNFLRLCKIPGQLARTLLFTKHHEWKHEEEFRIFRHKVSASTVTFPRRVVTRVILGCRCESEELNLVRAWLTGFPSDVVISRAKPADSGFNLEIDDIEVVRGQATI